MSLLGEASKLANRTADEQDYTEYFLFANALPTKTSMKTSTLLLVM
jgi:hypothetical protein